MKKGGGLRNTNKSKSKREEDDLFSNLSPEIVICILSRLPIRTLITSCKFVCKSWRHLISSHEFAVSHFSQSAPFLVIFEGEKCCREPYKLLQFVDRYNELIIGFDFPRPVRVHSSANGLLFLLMSHQHKEYLYNKEFICNPITREYIELPWHEASSDKHQTLNYGFGVSRVSGLCKVVRIFSQSKDSPCMCEVYTLGTGSWRSVEAPARLRYPWRTFGSVVLKGNLHWLVRETDQPQLQKVSCFDLETERFSTFSIPRLDGGGDRRLCASEDYGLCLCGDSNGGSVTWSMKEYGDDKSWRKEFVIKKPPPYKFCATPLLPVKIFEDGGILFVIGYGFEVYCYSSKTGTFRSIKPTIPLYIDETYAVAAIYTPSFLPLKTLVRAEDVTSF